jgi:hypothetical protein
MKRHQQKICRWCEKPKNSSAETRFDEDDSIAQGFEEDYECQCDSESNSRIERMRVLNFNHENYI